ncbi:hypothetical protein TNCV_1570081 [Trichonephila clavipes]|uniref:Uncharacterized protein n=1 Tax=Trichonephila clavipes TaxID=2585209 RepID=A0A8X6SPP8_TRICX|nr:hypothetical protein TNCV_1570081 [Trichonephila clavipes]
MPTWVGDYGCVVAVVRCAVPGFVFSTFGNPSASPASQDGVVGLSLAFCTQGCGFDPGPSRGIFMMQKIDSGHVV